MNRCKLLNEWRRKYRLMPYRRTLCTLSAIAYIVCSPLYPAAAQTSLTTAEKSRAIDTLLTIYHANGAFNGTALVADSNGVILKKGYGYANFELLAPNRPHTKFRIASVTKPFIAFLTLQLAREGLLDLNDALSDYLPDVYYPGADDIELTHLLSHTSGIPHYEGIDDFWNVYCLQSYSTGAFVNIIERTKPLFEPGEQFAYSSLGYYVLGAIIERVTGESLAEVLRKKLLIPCGLYDTGLDSNTLTLPHRASGYTLTLFGPQNARYRDMSTVKAAGGMYSTVEDLYAWDRLLYSTDLLEEEHLRLMLTPIRNNYALGWAAYRDSIAPAAPTVSIAQHTGSFFGFRSRFERITSERNLIVLLDNTQTPDSTLDDIAAAIKRILYDQPQTPPKISAARFLAVKAQQCGIACARAALDSAMRAQPDAYGFSVDNTLYITRALENGGETTMALSILSAGAHALEEPDTLYREMAAILRRLGQQDDAIDYYRDILEYDSKNSEALTMLRYLDDD